jgi:hypothetical protein
MRTSQIVVLDFEFTGILDVEADAAIVAPTYPDENASKIRAANGVTEYDDIEMCLESMTFDFGNQVVPKKCINAPEGIDFFLVSDRMPKVTANPESKLVASQDWMGMMLTSDVAPLLTLLPAEGYVAGAEDHSVKILAPRAQIKNKTPGNREGIAIDDLEFDCCINTADANNLFSIEFMN